MHDSGMRLARHPKEAARGRPAAALCGAPLCVGADGDRAVASLIQSSSESASDSDVSLTDPPEFARIRVRNSITGGSATLS